MIALTCTFFILFRDKFARIRAHTGLTVLNVKKNVSLLNFSAQPPCNVWRGRMAVII